MTDREKIQGVLESFDVPLVEKSKSIAAAGRKMYFNEAGELERVIDYVKGFRATPTRQEDL